MVQLGLAVDEVNQLLLIQVAQITLKRSASLEQRNTDSLAGLVVVVDFDLITLAVAERNVSDLVDVLRSISAFVQRLQHVQLNRITAETLKTVFLDLSVVLPDVSVEFVAVLKLEFFVLQCFLFGFIDDLYGFVLRQTALQLFVGQTSFLHQLFLRRGLQESNQRVITCRETTVLVVEFQLCCSQIYQIFDDTHFTLGACFFKLNGGHYAHYAEVCH